MKKYKIVIAGAGQLGSRYLQGLVKCSLPLSVYVTDISSDSLSVARSRWLEAGGDKTEHEVQFSIGYDNLPHEIDLVIVSTHAQARPAVVEALVGKVTVKNWLLEKILAQSEEKIIHIQSLIGNDINAWVNTPYRAMDWYRKIKAEMHLGGTFYCEIKAGKTFGLACNAIHYLDLLSWFSGETVIDINTAGLEKEWFESKRPGFWDIFGSIEISFSKGSKAVINSGRWEPSKITIDIQTDHEKWVIHESDGIAIRNNDFILKGRDEYQSEMTATLVESILRDGTCLLPKLEESARLHFPMLKAFRDHWNANRKDTCKEVPIT